MDVPKYEKFPSQSWDSWHGIESSDYEMEQGDHEKVLTFNADKIIRQAVSQRGSVEDRRQMGIIT